jgi:hypothetical protein
VVLYIKPSRYINAEKRDELYKAATLFLNELMDPDEKTNVIIEISVKGSGLQKFVDGYCLCTDEDSKGRPKEIAIDIRGDRGLDYAIKCMAHEIVHAWQMITGRIDIQMHADLEDHYNAPWEVEARELEEPLYEIYLQNS